MKIVLEVIDSLSEWAGKVGGWFCSILVLIMTTEVIMRYGFNRPTMWSYETSLMLGASIYFLGLGSGLRRNAHIRVDVFYNLLSPRWRLIIDVACTLLLFIPLFVALTYISGALALRAWLIHEVSVETNWYPPIAPLKTTIAVGCLIFLFQGGAKLFRDSYLLTRKRKYD